MLSGNDWYFYLFNRLTESLRRSEDFENYKDNRISIITFNYDRSLENFLYLGITRNFKEYQGGRPLSAAEILPFPIVHVYGQVAPLPWQSDKSLEYAPDFHANAVDLADNIKLIDDRITEDVKEAKDIIKQAKRIFFLGFGYAEENLNVLGLPDILSMEQKLYGTAIGMTERGKRRIKNSICKGMLGDKTDLLGNTRLAQAKVKIENMDCLKILQEYL